MRAVRMHEYGDASVLRVEEVERPKAGPNDLRIAVHATSINPIDTKIRAGSQRALIPLRFPWSLGMDVSGVVIEVGTQVSDFAVGDEVFASPSHRRMGCYAEEVAVRADECALKPSSITHEEAAGLPLVGLTAWNALVDACALQPGQTVLIQAGSGGVGTFAIQLAKHLGAEVLATCSTRNVELVTGLGADRVIDYTQENYEEVAKGCDAVLETLGGSHLDQALRTVKRGGTVAAVTMNLPYYAKRHGPVLGVLAMAFGFARRWARAWLRFGVRLRPVTRRADGQTLAKIAELVDAGVIRPIVDRVLPLEQADEAHRYAETGRARGKIILRVPAPA